MDQTRRGRTSLPTQSMAPNTGHQHSPSYSLLASAALYGLTTKFLTLLTKNGKQFTV